MVTSPVGIPFVSRHAEVFNRAASTPPLELTPTITKNNFCRDLCCGGIDFWSCSSAQMILALQCA
ncbi:hypothetical protein E2C01_102607 [Portunus trituberculatus]|uniref:Uncharacterized protein n=1 Tax=Portunus trituberculatus TaxID=210409 RepID=A0A5B7KN75_PORTR|nr:hypothetical protein [Portunus trituberculatus]